MRLLLLSHTGAGRGGAEYVLSETIEAFASEEALHVIYPRKGGDSVASPRASSAVIPYFMWYKEPSSVSFLKLIFNLSLFLRYRRELDRSKYDTLVINTSACFFGLLLALRGRGRVIIHIHEVADHNTLQKLFFEAFWRRRIPSRTVIFVSESLCDQWRSRYVISESECRVVYNPIKKLRSAGPQDPHRFTFGFIGTLERNKRVFDLVEAYQELKRADGCHEIRLAIAGDGSLYEALKTIAKDDGGIILSGHISDVASFYDGIDALVVPSRYESFSLVAAEAMSLGKPVITNARVGITELLTDRENYLSYKYGDVDDLAMKMRLLHDDRSFLERLSRNARDFFERELSQTKYRERIYEAIR